ncbi:MAG TPA: L,D-transpeptidase [Mariprofundaceae bacterium]|nr:L,D-transpeptidase [Mariprofundaceae bacterium]
MIVISVSEQRLYHRRKTGVWYSYPVSTASRGTGNVRDSYQTPLGRHRICSKIGEDMPAMTVFRGRKPVGFYQPGENSEGRDWILSRILWLDGMQTGVNRRGQLDTKSRYIYIHGTHAEDKIGSPASHGCIRMDNADILELFEHARTGEHVLIRSQAFHP